MGKIYLDKNVYEAFKERVNYIFDEFDNICFSVSAGKDSSVMVQLANIEAIKRGRTFDVMFVDYEAQYKMTIEHLYELKKLSNIRDFYHICWLMRAGNASSVFSPFWNPWRKEDESKWVRSMPTDNIITVDNNPFGNFFKPEIPLSEISSSFAKWYTHKYSSKCAFGIGIRADESFHRFRAIAFGKNIYKGKKWTTLQSNSIINFYPVYDFKTEDIWVAVNKCNLTYNMTYEQMYKNGVGIHAQRICQPYGADQRVSLNQWAVLEPETWHKIVNRVSGANFGALYCKSSLLGHNRTEKPKHMNWEQYAVFLLETTGLYSKELMDHYVRKIKIFFEHYEKEYNVRVSDIQDEIEPKLIKEEYAESGKWIHWKRIARAIEKNDFSMRSLSYGLTKKDKEVMITLKNKWGKMLGIQQSTKEMRNLSKEIGYEED